MSNSIALLAHCALRKEQVGRYKNRHLRSFAHWRKCTQKARLYYILKVLNGTSTRFLLGNFQLLRELFFQNIGLLLPSDSRAYITYDKNESYYF